MEENKHHYLVAALLGVVGLMIILIFVVIRSQAEDPVDLTMGVTNLTAEISQVNFGTSTYGDGYNNGNITLASHDVTSVYVNGTITDGNGCLDIDGVSDNYLGVSFYRSGTDCDPVTGSEDGENCYILYQNGANCEISGCTGGTDTDALFSCHFDNLKWYATAGPWKAKITITDDSSQTATLTTSSNEPSVAVLTSMNIPTNSIAFGNVTSGASSTEKTLEIQNYGNDTSLDIMASSTVPAMTCSISGDIDYDDIVFSSSTGAWGTKVNSPDNSLFVMGLDKGSDLNTVPSALTYWQAQVDINSLGSCTGAMTITAQ